MRGDGRVRCSDSSAHVVMRLDLHCDAAVAAALDQRANAWRNLSEIILDRIVCPNAIMIAAISKLDAIDSQ